MKTYRITAKYNGELIIRTAYGDKQAWILVNQLYRDGCTDVGMREVQFICNMVKT